MFQFLRRLFGGSGGKKSGTQAPITKPEAGENPDDELEAQGICGPPGAGTPIVFAPKDGMMVILDRMAYEYQQGMTPGVDPTRGSLEHVLRKATRVRVLDGGMYREDSLGTNVLFEEEDRASIRELVDALGIVDDPESFNHCMCLGEPSLEFFDEDELLATVAIHHGRSIRWAAWKHDAILEDGAGLARWMADRGIELGEGPRNPGDVMMMGLLSLKPANRFAARAWSYLQRGAMERAEEELDRAEEADANLALIPALRAEMAFQSGNFADGLELAEEASRRGHRDANVLKTMAACLDGLGRSEEALARCAEAIALDPEQPAVRNSRGFILARMGRFDDAREDFLEATRLAPEWVLPLFHLAMLESEQGNSAPACHLITRTIDLLESGGAPPTERLLGPHSIATLHAVRAGHRISLGDLEGGREDAGRAIELDPDDPNGYAQRGRALGMLGRYSEAAEDFETLTRLVPGHPQSWIFLAQALAGSEQPEGAVDAIGEALQLDPENTYCLAFRAQALMHFGRWAEASEDVEEAIRIRPDDANHYLLRSFCHKAAGDHHRQLEDLWTARRWSPDEPRILNSLAWILSTCPIDSLRDGPRAESLAMQAADLTEGRDSEVINTLAAAHAENGKFKEARERLRQSIEMAPPGYNAEEREKMRLAFEQDRPFRTGG